MALVLPGQHTEADVSHFRHTDSLIAAGLSNAMGSWEIFTDAKLAGMYRLLVSFSKAHNHTYHRGPSNTSFSEYRISFSPLEF
jgi:hypothetical protein